MRYKYLLFLALIVLGAVLRVFSLGTPPDSETLLETDPTPYQVTHIIDGDTIKIRKDGQEETLRLIGIDTPETDPTYNDVECYGKEATEETKRLLTNSSVSIQFDGTQAKRDKYGRLLVYILLPDGTNLNQHLIKQGFAKEYTYAEPYKYQTEFKAAEAKARTQGRGLWSRENCPS